jgi:D-alanyl-D-alanine carboxypeptidase
MRARLPMTLLVVLATMLAVTLPTAAVAARPTDWHAELDHVVAAGAPGAILLRRDGGHTTVLASGLADVAARRPMAVDDRFRAASQMKSFTAAVVLQLAQENRLHLDDPVESLLPGVVPNGAHITVRQLLAHNSGLYDFNNDPQVLAPYLAGDLGHVWTPRELLAIAFSHPPLFAPGTRFAYSDTGYFVAGLIVEKLTGHRLADEVRDRILVPLGLRDTSLPSTPKIAGPHAHGYYVLGAPPPTDITGLYPYAWAAGGLVTTAADSARFYRALLGGELLSPAMVREMQQTIPVDDSDLPSRSGLGVQRFTPCGVAWGHSGNYPGYLVYTFVSPDTARETVLMVNEDPKSLPKAALAGYYDLLVRAHCQH